MSDVIRGNAVIGQSGGPTAVVNQSLVGVIETISRYKQVGRLLGARHGVRGIKEEKFIDLKPLGRRLLDRLAETPAAALGSSRDKPDEEYCRKIFDVFAKHNVRYFFYIGGNDSADSARIIDEMAAEADYELRTLHIPKTIDNDLRVTDHCPGYGSAAKFVASAFMGDDRDSASLPGIKINVMMGRHAGWLTAASALGRQDAKDGPHLVYVPERPFSTRQFARDVAKVFSRLGRCQIAVSEGIADRAGKPIAEKLAEDMHLSVERDSHGNIQLSGSGALGDFLSSFLKHRLSRKVKNLRVRADTFGYLQRSFAGYASEVDRKEARLAGRKAVEYAMSGDLDGSVAFKRLRGKEYRIECFLARLKDVARETKHLPARFINRAGNGVTESFRRYAMPLVGKLPVTAKLF